MQIKEVLNFVVKVEKMELKLKQSCKVVVCNITSDYSTEEIKSSSFDERGNQLEVLEVTRLKRKVANQMLEIRQWNIISANKKKIAQLTQFINKRRVDIICLQETILNEAKRLEIQGYKIYRKDGSSLRRGGGAAVLIREDLKHSSLININLTQDNDVVGILVERKDGKRIKIYSYYNPNGNLDILSNIEKLVASEDELLSVGDFNRHSKL
ncbi:hypothetical protein QYM36_008040 [Artemia franciscana]|uniref:Endonuclease/exonuclease/phosphatase domain-containing protein n=1 Tax=Artemia franciscana TaxID=6661 RepID=A0AA88LM48_ARTSF|nr:hypothetical protein QYM36_008040 [Artemia franciscana]